MIGAAIALVFFGAVCFAGLALSVASRPATVPARPAPARTVRPTTSARPSTAPVRVEAIQIPRQRRPSDVHDAAAMQRYRETQAMSTRPDRVVRVDL